MTCSQEVLGPSSLMASSKAATSSASSRAVTSLSYCSGLTSTAAGRGPQGGHVVFEEARIHVEGCSGRGTSDPVLNLLDVGSSGNGDARRRIPKVVRCEVRRPDGLDGGVEHSASEVAQSDAQRLLTARPPSG